MNEIQGLSEQQLKPEALQGSMTQVEDRGFIKELETVDHRRPEKILYSGSQVVTSSINELRRVVDGGMEGLVVNSPSCGLRSRSFKAML
jgi:hypothetical protein